MFFGEISDRKKVRIHMSTTGEKKKTKKKTKSKKIFNCQKKNTQHGAFERTANDCAKQ
jgi:hypothetical protein